MSIELNDLEDLIRGICHRFGISEKDFMTDWRLGVRALWDQSPIKRTYHDSVFIYVDNTNPRSMKRFPKVKRWECSICKGLFEKKDTELDHVLGENPCTKFEHAATFLHSIALPRNHSDLQVVCKECHAVKTYAERYKVSMEEARVRKLVASLRSSEVKQAKKLKELGVSEADMPKSKAAKERLLVQILMAQIGD